LRSKTDEHCFPVLEIRFFDWIVGQPHPERETIAGEIGKKGKIETSTR
jgi:hypothetical protein